MSAKASSYEFIDHTADLGIIVRGPDVGGLFSNAARAMTELMVKGDLGEKRTTRSIVLEAEDYPDLMVRWLGEVLYLFSGERLITDTIEIRSISPAKLEARLAMAGFDSRRHRIIREIKAVTYHGISVQMVKDEWESHIIFDI